MRRFTLLGYLFVSLLAAPASADDERPPGRDPDLLGAFERMTAERNQWREAKDELAAMHSDALADYLVVYMRLHSLRVKVLHALSDDWDRLDPAKLKTALELAVDPLPLPSYREREKLHPGITERSRAQIAEIQRRLAERRLTEAREAQKKAGGSPPPPP